MVLINETSIFGIMFYNYTVNVFGNPYMTSIMLLLGILLIALMIRIPFPISIALLIPITLVLLAVGYLPVMAGGIIIIILMLVAGFSFSRNMM